MSSGEQEFAGLFAGHLQVSVNGFARLVGQFETDWTPCLLLAHDRATAYPFGAMSSTVRLTTSHPRSLLSIARLNSAKLRTCPSIWSLVRIDHTCLGRRGGLAPINFPFFQGMRIGAGGIKSSWVCMVVLLVCWC